MRLLFVGVIHLAVLGSASALDPTLPIDQLQRQQWFLEEGLPQAAAMAIAQDGQGFVWVGTQDGLARFDGRDFEVFEPENTPGLADDNIYRLYYDTHRETLWIGSKRGLSRFRQGRFQHLKAGDFGEIGSVNDLSITTEEVLIASETGLYRVVGDGLTPYQPRFQEPVYSVRHVEDGVWLSLRGRLLNVRPDGQSTLTELPSDSLIVKNIYPACGEFWLATTRGLYFLTAAGLQRQATIPEANINDLYCDPGEVLWVGTGRSLHRLHNGVEIERVSDTDQFPDLWITDLLPGRENGLWVGTISGGLYRLSERRYERLNALGGFRLDTVWAVTEAPHHGGVWAAGANTLVRIVANRVAATRAPPELADSVVMTALEDTTGRLWVGTRNSLISIDVDGTSVQTWLNEGTAAIVQDSAGGLWFGSLSGIYQLRGERLEKLAHPVTRIRTLAATEHGLLVGSEQGAFRLAGDELLPLQAPAGPVSAFHISDHVNWLGYLGNGLARGTADGWIRYTEADGLLADSIYFIGQGADEWLWLSSNKGVFRIRPTANGTELEVDPVVSITGREAGSSQGYCCNGGASAAGVIDDQGQLWLPSLDGVVRVSTGQAASVRNIPEVVMKSLTTGQRQFDFSQPLALSAGERDLSFRFTAVYFEKPGALSYAYRLVGYDDDWRRAQRQGRADYTNLPAGDYVFEAIAVVGKQSSVTPARWAFSIAPAYYQTHWFRGAVVVLFCLLFYSWYRWRVVQLYRQRRALESLVAERTADLQEANERLEAISTQDTLTQLGNRRYLLQRIAGDIRATRAKRKAHDDLTVLFLVVDLDDFKQINDRYGHHAGDEVLVEVARRLASAARESDYVVRWGGEEFLVVAPSCPASLAGEIAGRLQHQITAQPVPISNHEPLPITASIGFSRFPFEDTTALEEDWMRVVNLADAALYHVKRSGRNSWAGIVPTGETQVALAQLARAVEQRLAEGALQLIEPGQ